jgi:hypothetical protein
MGATQLSNPIGEEGEGWLTEQVIETYQYDPSVTSTTTLSNGMVVIVSSGFINGATATSVTSTQYPVIRKATTTPSFTNIGVVVNAPTGGYVPGSFVQVCTKGITQVLCDANNTTFGHLLLAGSTTAGAATDSATATLGKTIAICLQTATIASGTALVYGYVGLY